MIEYIQRCWKGLATIMGMIALAGGIITLPTFVATPADIEKVKSETKQTIQELKKSIELDRDIARLNQINDSIMKAKILLRQYPNDKDLKEDIETLKEDKQKLQERIEKR
jgi:biopolymer transport protein ExbB/TolQ